MSKINYIEKIIIPRTFKIGGYTIFLKRELEGYIYETSFKHYQYLGDNKRIKIDINRYLTKEGFISNLQYMILNAYKKYNNEESEDSLTDAEYKLLDFIDYCINDVSEIRKILFIGYKYNYPITILNTLSRCNFICDSILIDKNIELYNPKVSRIDNDFKPIFNKIMKAVNKNNYDAYVLDVPNLSISTKYINTKKVLKNLEAKNKKIMIIAPNIGTKFKNIFGDSYSKILIESNYMIRIGDSNITRRQIDSIL